MATNDIYAKVFDEQVLNSRDVRTGAASLCCIELADVEAIYPATPIQEDVSQLAIHSPDATVGQVVIELEEGVDVAKITEAWRWVEQSTPVMRLRMGKLSAVGLVQIVSKSDTGSIEVLHGDIETELSSLAARQKQNTLKAGAVLTNANLLEDERFRRTVLCWTFSYAALDQPLQAKIFNRVWHRYQCLLGKKEHQSDGIENNDDDAIKTTKAEIKDDGSVGKFWRKEAGGPASPNFPDSEGSMRSPRPSENVEHEVAYSNTSAGCTAQQSIRSVIHAAWAILIARYTDCEDVVFGTLHRVSSAGRGPPFGPSSRLAFIRVSLALDQSPLSLIAQLESKWQAMLPHSEVGLYDLHNFARGAVNFRNIVKVSDADEAPRTSQGVKGTINEPDGFGPYTQYTILLECTVRKSSILLQAKYDPQMINSEQMRRILAQLDHILQQLKPGQYPERINDVQVTSDRDVEEIREWNSADLKCTEACIHHVIESHLSVDTARLAVSSADMVLTRSELSNLSSRLALHLVARGVMPEQIVPIYCERSAWILVAILGVLKAGAAVVLLDPATPATRIELICRKVGAAVAIVPRGHGNHFEQVVTTVIPISWDWLNELPEADSTMLPLTTPRSLAYVIFTSGSTGQPKGALIEHQAWVSAGLQYGKAIKMDDVRALQFASYSFVLCLIELTVTLMLGGCVFIPSAHDRANNLAEIVNENNVNWAAITPSLAGTLRPDAVHTLRTLVLGGEAVTADVLARWGGRVELIYAYGMSEVSGFCSSSVARRGSDSRNMGRGSGARLWIVDLTDRSRLAPIGCIGELVVESPGVARGYLGQDSDEGTPFLSNAGWVQAAGQTSMSRYYVTGDLVRYASDGTILFLGRQDSQIKLRGQRVEVLEVEYYIRGYVPEQSKVAVVLIPRPGGPSASVLVACLSGPAWQKSGDMQAESKSSLALLDHDRMENLRVELCSVLPGYMIPSLFLYTQCFPATSTGKTNYARLRELGSNALDNIRQASIEDKRTKDTQLTRKEQILRQLWARIFHIDAESLSGHANFVHLGGDSLAAMTLVSNARMAGLSLTVAQIFTWPKLEHLADISSLRVPDFSKPPVEFSMLPEGLNVELLQAQAASLCGVMPEEVEDIYSCTPLQQGMSALSSISNDEYVVRGSLHLSGSMNLQQFREACQMVVQSTPILRTRIVVLDGLGLCQVVIKGNLLEEHAHDPATYMKLDAQKSFLMGEPLTRFALIRNEKESTTHFLWSAHHATIDGWSVPLMVNRLKRLYEHEVVAFGPPFKAFVQYVQSRPLLEARDFWRAQMDGFDSSCFPSLPEKRSQVRANQSIKSRFELPRRVRSTVTRATLIRAAWALTIARHTGIEDVCFGITVTGRSAPVPGVEDIIGPTIATVPVRIQVSLGEPIQAFLERVQQQMADIVPFEHIGIQTIRKVSAAAKSACDFGTLLVFQTGNERLHDARSLGNWQNDNNSMSINTYPLLLECWRDSQTLSFYARFDAHHISEDELLGLLEQLAETTSQLLSSAPGATVGSLDIAREQGLRRIWEGNAVLPEASSSCVQDLFHRTTLLHPDSTAVSAWDGEFTYSQLDCLSSELAHHLVALDVGKEVIVPLCFEKSSWMVIAIVAVMKAGGSSLALDVSLPEERLSEMVRQVAPVVIASSMSCKPLAHRLVSSGAVVSVPCAASITRHSADELPKSIPMDALYVVFTSGSTGKAKGIVITHGNFVAAAELQQKRLGFHSDSRVLDFASCAFDVFWSNVLHTLTAGGCLCIPQHRLADMVSNILDFSVNYVHVTPSVSRIIDWRSVKSLKTLHLSGEPLQYADISGVSAGVTVINSYGPAECTVTATAEVWIAGTEASDVPSIGLPCGSLIWLVDPKNTKLLVPHGSVGEIWIEGPLVARGYLDSDPAEAAFISDLPWLAHDYVRRGRAFRTGDLGRFRSDGKLHFVGRKDLQVKIRGQRVELVEVEYSIRQLLLQESNGPNLLVVADIVSPNSGGKPMLVAILAPLERIAMTNEELTATTQTAIERLKGDIARKLPSYMVPSKYITLAELPMTPTGKTDRLHLRQMLSSMSSVQPARTVSPLRATPSSSGEELLRNIWADVLQLSPDEISTQASFFGLGGDSIDAMYAASKARAHRLSVSVADILRFETIERIAREAVIQLDTISLMDATDQQIPVFEGSMKSYPCTPMQEAILLSQRIGKASYMSIKIWSCSNAAGPNICIERLIKAWETTLRRHSIFSAVFVEDPDAGVFKQMLIPDYKIEIDQIPCAGGKSPEQVLQNIETPKLVRKEPEWRLTICRCESTGTVACRMDVNHALLDAPSMALLERDVARAYHSHLSTVPSQFVDAAKYLKQMPMEESLGYWKHFLDSVEPCHLVTRTQTSQIASDTSGCGMIDLWTDNSPAILGFCKSRDITRSNFLQVAWALVLSYYSGSSSVCFGRLVPGRNLPIAGIDEMVGPLMNMIIDRVSLDEGLDEAFRKVKQSTAEQFEHQNVSLAKIQHELGLGAEKLFNTVLSVRDAKGRDTKDSELVLSELIVDDPQEFDIVLRATLNGSSTSLAIVYRHAALTAAAVQEFAGSLESSISFLLSQ